MTAGPDAHLRPPHAGAGLRIGLLGGSFNPPHDGHRQVSLELLRRLRLDRVWWLVSPGNPLKSHEGLPTTAARVAACERVADHPRIEVTAFEESTGSAFTVETVAFLSRRFPATRFVWIMGADNLAGFERWKGWRKIFELMPIAVADRPGWRYRALASCAAITYAAARIDEADAAGLPERPAPAWAFLGIPLSPLSSTKLREAARRRRG